MATIGPQGANFQADEIIKLTVAGVAVVVVLYWLAKQEVKSAVKSAADFVQPFVEAANPASQNNIVQKVGTAIYQMGDEKRAQQGLTLSTAIVDWFNLGGVNDYDPNAVAKK